MTFQEIMLNEISNQVLRKDVTYDNIKSHKKQGFTLSLENVFGKTTGDSTKRFPNSKKYHLRI